MAGERLEAYFRVLEYLYENTDKEHPVTQAELRQKKELKDWYWKDNGTAYRAMGNLITLLNSDENGIVREQEDWRIFSDGFYREYYDEDAPEEDGRSHRTGKIYYRHLFDRDEIWDLVEAVRFSKSIPQERSDSLVDKIQNHLTPCFNRSALKIRTIKELSVDRELVNRNLQVLQECIQRQCQVEFTFNYYDAEMHLVPYRSYIASPHFLVAHNNHYYAIVILADKNGEHMMRTMRVDLLTGVSVHLENGKPKVSVPKQAVFGFPMQCDEDFFRTHPGMAYDAPERITLRIAPRTRYAFLLDAFGAPGEGKTMQIGKKLEDESQLVHIKCSPWAMTNFAMQYSEQVEVIAPPHVREAVMNRIKLMCGKYGVK